MDKNKIIKNAINHIETIENEKDLSLDFVDNNKGNPLYYIMRDTHSNRYSQRDHLQKLFESETRFVVDSYKEDENNNEISLQIIKLNETGKTFITYDVFYEKHI